MIFAFPPEVWRGCEAQEWSQHHEWDPGKGQLEQEWERQQGRMWLPEGPSSTSTIHGASQFSNLPGCLCCGARADRHLASGQAQEVARGTAARTMEGSRGKTRALQSGKSRQLPHSDFQSSKGPGHTVGLGQILQ